MTAGRRFDAPRGRSRPVEDPPGTSRLFIAVPVADEIRDQIGTLMEQLAGGPVDRRGPGQPRWVRVEGLHLTLRFLGATPDMRLQELGEAVAAAAAGVAPFRVELNGGGAFPNPHNPRVLWIGIGEGVAQLGILERRVDVELRRLGWPADDRPFSAHLTLARTDGVAGAAVVAGRLIEAARDVNLSWEADRLVLYKSNLGHGPTHYEALAEARLVAS
jgi:RNA 2',3'-cyclic 3'-phosphodiesterase